MGPHIFRASTCLTLLLLFLLPAALMAQTSSAALSGRILDPTGAAIPGVTITATNVATGFSRTTVSASDGTYRFATLPVGTYRVTAELSGFGSVTVENVELNVATDRPLDINLTQAAVQESITVTADAPLVATSPAVGTVVSQEELENLPLNGRQFANLASLAPGTSLGVNPDPTKPGQLVVALNGGIGRNVNYMIDGGDNTDDTIGGALQNFNLEAVQEFKIQTQQYKAELGRSSGGVLTVVTKTGTNDLSGSVYGYFRDKSLNSKTTAERRAGREKQDYERNQYGFSVGGPIIRDRAHFFGTYETTDRDTRFIVNTDRIFPELDNRAFPMPYGDDLITAKATWEVSSGHQLQLRYGAQSYKDVYSASAKSTPTNLGTINSEYWSLLGGHNAQLGSNMYNELIVQWSDFENQILPASTDPTLIFPNGVTSGQNVNTPQTTLQEKRQFKNDFSYSTTLAGRRHDFKTGVNYINVPTLGGAFSAGKTGWYTFRENSVDSEVTQILVFGGDFQFSTPVDQYSVYVQDDWQITDQLQVNAGIRYDLWTGFDLDQSSNPIWQALSTQTQYNERYLQPFQGGRGGQLENDDNNWGPRLGFMYDVRGDARHIVRGGWGIYYDFPYTNATILFPSAAVQSNYGLAYLNSNPNGIKNADGTLYQFGQPLPPNQLPANGLTFPPNEVASPNLATPRSTQMSIGYSTQLTPWMGVTLDVVDIQYRDIPFRFRANPFDPATGKRRFPQFGHFRLWSSDGEADYTGVNLGVRARAGNRLELQGFYTWSEATGNILAGADEFRITAAGHQPDLAAVPDQSVNPLDPNCAACFGPLNTDATHRFTLSAVYRAPFGILVSGVARYRSGYPYTEWAGADLNGDGFTFDLADGVTQVNSRRGDDFSQVDVRLSREFALTGGLGIEVIGEIFNLFNADNPARYNGNRRSAGFGQPSAFAGDPGQGEQRLAQLGLRLRF